MGNLAVGIRGLHLPVLMGRIGSLIASSPTTLRGDPYPDMGGVAFYNNNGGTLARGALIVLGGVNSETGLPAATAAQAGVTGKRATYVVLESVASAKTGVAAVSACLTTTLDTSGSSIGAKVYLSTTAAGITLTGGGASQIVGSVASLSTSGKVLFDLTRAPTISSNIGRLSVLTAAGTSYTNNNTEKVLASATIAANTIKAGTRVVINARLRATAETGATTLTSRIRIGATTLTGTAVYTSAATDNPGAGANQVIQFTLTGRAAPGAAAECVGSGLATVLATAGDAAAISLNSTNFATNGDLLVELTGQWSAADANAAQAEEFSVDILDA